MSLRDIDFADRYRTGMKRSNRPERLPSYWDTRASGMGARTFQSGYTRAFIDRLDLTNCHTLLDVGCGPGTIGLSVGHRLEHVYGLDYSPGMLAAFVEQARARRLTAVTPILRAWDEDWSDVPVCDVVVASRATAVPDFEAAAKKLTSKARRRVYLTYPAHGHFVSDSIYRAIGRPCEPLPDYLCVVGVLHHLGFDPSLDYLSDTNRFAGSTGFDDFVTRVRDFVGDLTPGDLAALAAYFDEHGLRIGEEPMRWAFVSWNVPGTARVARRFGCRLSP